MASGRLAGGAGIRSVNLLIILNDPPYGTERSYNGIRMALEVAKRDGCEVKMFLLADSVGCAVAGQQVPKGYYQLDRMLDAAGRRGAVIGCCGTCMDARAIGDDQLIPAAHRSSMAEFGGWTEWADKIATF